MTTHGIPGEYKVPETGRVYLNSKHLLKVCLVVNGENIHFSSLKSLVHKGARAGELGGCVCAHELLLEAVQYGGYDSHHLGMLLNFYRRVFCAWLEDGLLHFALNQHTYVEALLADFLLLLRNFTTRDFAGCSRLFRRIMGNVTKVEYEARYLSYVRMLVAQDLIPKDARYDELRDVMSMPLQKDLKKKNGYAIFRRSIGFEKPQETWAELSLLHPLLAKIMQEGNLMAGNEEVNRLVPMFIAVINSNLVPVVLPNNKLRYDERASCSPVMLHKDLFERLGVNDKHTAAGKRARGETVVYQGRKLPLGEYRWLTKGIKVKSGGSNPGIGEWSYEDLEAMYVSVRLPEFPAADAPSTSEPELPQSQKEVAAPVQQKQRSLPKQEHPLLQYLTVHVKDEEDPQPLFKKYTYEKGTSRLCGSKTFTLCPVLKTNGKDVHIKLLENHLSLKLTYFFLDIAHKLGLHTPAATLRLVKYERADYARVLDDHVDFRTKYANKTPLLEAKPAGVELVLETEVIRGCNMSKVPDSAYKDMPLDCVLSLLYIMLLNKWFGVGDMNSTNIMLDEVHKRFVRIDCCHVDSKQIAKFNAKRLQPSQRMAFGTHACAAVSKCLLQEHVALADFCVRMRTQAPPKHPGVVYWLFDDEQAAEALRRKDSEALNTLYEDIVCKLNA